MVVLSKIIAGILIVLDFGELEILAVIDFPVEDVLCAHAEFPGLELTLL